MTKKYIYILFSCIVILLVTTLKDENTMYIFNETYDDYNFDNHIISFNECDLNVDNFIEKFLYFDDKDYKILSITPYINEPYKDLFNNIDFNYYSNDLNKIISSFKSKYLSVMDNENYISNICIKSIKINTANIYIKEFKNYK